MNDKTYNGYVGFGDSESAYCTWNVDLYFDNDSNFYNDKIRLLKQLKKDDIDIDAESLKQFVLDKMPKGTLDISYKDARDKVNYQELADVWNDEKAELRD